MTQSNDKLLKLQQIVKYWKLNTSQKTFYDKLELPGSVNSLQILFYF
jgi:hypothetical protein